MSEAVPTPSEKPSDFGWVLGVLLRSYRERVGVLLGEFPQGSRGYETLAEVVRGAQPSQLALANRLGIDRTIMTYVIDDLVAAELVERRPNAHDRRQRQIVATERGRKVVAELCEQVTLAERAVLGALNDRERTVLRGLLDKAAGGDPRFEPAGNPCELADEMLGGASG